MAKNILSTRSIILRELKDYLFISIGVILYTMGMTVFMLPYGLTSGGVSGISSIIYYTTGVEVQITYVIINIILLIAAIKVLGVKFCVKTIYAVFFMTFALWAMQRIIEIPDPDNPGQFILPKLIGNESFMACILGAIFGGLGLCICFESNGSTGGTDIIAAIVNKYKPISLGSVIMACDIIIISSCYFVFHDWARVIYGFVMLFVCSVTLDYTMRRQHQSVQFMIFSRNPDAIADAIIKTEHGATILDGEGWYTHTTRKVVLSIIRQREQMMILRMIKEIDPYAFVTMSEARGVWGEGFDMMKVNNQEKTKRVLVLASNSVHKLAETRAIFGDQYEIRSLADIGCYIDIPEKGNSLQSNALIKARFVKRYFGFDCIADDTALECEAINQMPGIYSRNYAAIDQSIVTPPADDNDSFNQIDEKESKDMLNLIHSHAPVVDKPKDHNVSANINKLLGQLADKDNRQAKVHTVLALITGDYETPDKWQTQLFDGTLNGTIATQPSGDLDGSFFYDSVFIPEGFNQTFEQLGPDVKNEISGRSIAIRKMKAFIESQNN